MRLVQELCQESLSAPVDLVNDRAYDLDGLTGRVVEFPVDVTLARVDRARVATAHGDDDIGLLCQLIGQRLGEFLAGVESTVDQERRDRRVQLLTGLGPGRAHVNTTGGVMVEQDPSRQTAPGVVDAEKQDDGLGAQDPSLGWWETTTSAASDGVTPG